MKRSIISKAILLFIAISIGQVTIAQDKEKKEGYKFKTKYEAPYTSVKNQYRSGTCWSFAGIAFLESEILRKTGDTTDLSEMYVVRNVYPEKAKKYVRFHGSCNFAGGGGFSDVLWSVDQYGIVPEDNYKGLNYGEENHVHGELDAVLKSYANAIIKNKNKKLSTAWYKGFNNIIDTYLGEKPESFTYKGQTYTPKSLQEKYDINPDDYIEITSYNHHPFYSEFILEIPDNWMLSKYYNVPLEDLIKITKHALKKGYAVGWDADVSDKGFSHSKGLAILPDTQKEDLSGTEKEKWEKLTSKEKRNALYSFDKPVKEKEITQESRQKDFDNYSATDDHLMLFTGVAKDQNRNEYFIVKNSWDTGNKYDGFFYASTPYVKDKTISILIHKDALPKKIRKKLNIK
ncbi:MAG: aminopeptidase C [Hyphomicrobiales bacterium]